MRLSSRVVGITCFLATLANAVASETYNMENYRKWNSNDVAPSTDKTFIKECGDCHVPFPPGLLPARSWEYLIDNLNKHFGEKLEYDEDTIDTIRSYVVANAADDSDYKRSRLIMESLQPSDLPKRILDVPHIRRKHRNLLDAYVKIDARPQNLANCDNCHPRAKEGIFSPSEVKTVWEKPKPVERGRNKQAAPTK